jgi:hypothetical protein
LKTESVKNFIRNKLFNSKDILRYIFYVLNFEIESYDVKTDDINFYGIMKLILIFGLAPMLTMLMPILKRQIFIHKNNENQYNIYVENNRKSKEKKK